MPKASTWTEWSITRSAGTSGSTPAGSRPARAIALRIAARSTTAGTPVKSWRITRAGRKATDAVSGAGAGQFASARTSSSVTWIEPAPRSAISSRTRTVYGRREVSAMPASSSRAMRKKSMPVWPGRAVRAPKGSLMPLIMPPTNPGRTAVSGAV